MSLRAWSIQIPWLHGLSGPTKLTTRLSMTMTTSGCYYPYLGGQPIYQDESPTPSSQLPQCSNIRYRTKEIRTRTKGQTFPPMMRPAEKSWFFPTFRRTSKVWYASSLVGDIIRTPSPSAEVHCRRYKASSTWKKKFMFSKSLKKTTFWFLNQPCPSKSKAPSKEKAYHTQVLSNQKEEIAYFVFPSTHQKRPPPSHKRKRKEAPQQLGCCQSHAMSEKYVQPTNR